MKYKTLKPLHFDRNKVPQESITEGGFTLFPFGALLPSERVDEILDIYENHQDPYEKIKPIQSVRGTKEMTKIVCICGSSRFCEIMAVCAWLIEREEKAITMGLHLLPVWYTNIPDHHLAEHEGVAEAMDELHLRKIDLADEIFVVNRNSYIGKSTGKEIEYAKKHGKKIRWYSHDEIGILVEKIIQEFLNKAPTTRDREEGKDRDTDC